MVRHKAGDPAFRCPRQTDLRVGPKVRDIAAYLRLDLGRHPEGPELKALISELSGAGAEFAEAWDRHEIRGTTHGHYVYRHPVDGEIALDDETLRFPDDLDDPDDPDDPDEALIMHTDEESVAAG